jgi:hypothetical protein
MSRNTITIASLASFIAGGMTLWSLGWARCKALSDLNYLDNADASDGVISHRINKDRTKPKTGFFRWRWDMLQRCVINAFAMILKFEFGDDLSVSSANNKTGPCIGEIFGLDVGGTLTKFVYFEQKLEENNRHSCSTDHCNTVSSATKALQSRWSSFEAHHAPDDESDSSCCPSSIRVKGSEGCGTHEKSTEPIESLKPMKRTRSMITLTKSMELEHAEALDHFYSFARRLDGYETALKDKHLSYYSRFLNGTFHFFRFETSRMHHAMNLVRYNDFHRSIKEIGATGKLRAHIYKTHCCTV